jgi:ankyrin repeat protein
MIRWIGIAFTLSVMFGATPEADIRAAAAKAVVVIQKSQQNWYTHQSCTSCHQQVFPALAFRAAREHGIPLDEAAAHADAAAAFGYFSKLDRAVEYTHIIDPPISDGYAMLGADAAGMRPSLVSAVYARLVAARQESDGRWETGDERPPQSYSPFTATAVAARAIQIYAHPSQKADVVARLERARAWLCSHEPRDTEERSFQILGARWSGAEQAALARFSAALTAEQRADGGWSSLDGLPSDAYSTAQALIALHQGAGLPTTSPAYQRGVAYLLRTQAPDGSWHVESRLRPPAPVSPKYFETGHPYGHDQFISTMGDCLAVMALADASARVSSARPQFAEAEPPAPEPWIETLLFGSAADVKTLLDRGFDPNSTSKAGGMPALMLAVPDLEKTKLLIERGANVDARAKNRYSALLVAAQYPNSSAVMNLLLDHGAKVRLPPGQGAPQYNASALFLAAYSGNVSILPRLRGAGDSPDSKMNVLGMFPVTPLLFLSTGWRTDAVKALLDLGGQVDETDGDGISLLEWAAIANRTDMARLFIERGADVNHVDKNGMTPLLYAASIDFGDSRMVDLLLKAGAHPDAKTPAGETALELARRYKHTHLIASLGSKR